MKRKSRKIAIIGVVLFELWANFLAYRKHGSGYIWEEYLYIAVVLWAVMVYFFFYDLSMKYYKKKDYVFSTYPAEEANWMWKEEKRLMQIKVFKTSTYIFGAAAPLYLLAYLDESDILKTNLQMPIIFSVIYITSLVLWMRLARRNNR